VDGGALFALQAVAMFVLATGVAEFLVGAPAKGLTASEAVGRYHHGSIHHSSFAGQK
jgi:hypothetical protein